MRRRSVGNAAAIVAAITKRTRAEITRRFGNPNDFRRCLRRREPRRRRSSRGGVPWGAVRDGSVVMGVMDGTRIERSNSDGQRVDIGAQRTVGLGGGGSVFHRFGPQ